MRNEELIVQHIPLALKLARVRQRRTLPMHVEIQDLESEALMALVQAGGRFMADGGACFKTFVSMRINGRLIEYMELSDMQWRFHEALRDVHQVRADLDERAMRAKLHRLISHLPVVWRRLLVMRFWLGFTQSETAKRMGLGVDRVGQIQRQALTRLRTSLEAYR